MFYMTKTILVNRSFLFYKADCLEKIHTDSIGATQESDVLQ
jgi:hypothetical protein